MYGVFLSMLVGFFFLFQSDFDQTKHIISSYTNSDFEWIGFSDILRDADNTYAYYPSLEIYKTKNETNTSFQNFIYADSLAMFNAYDYTNTSMINEKNILEGSIEMSENDIAVSKNITDSHKLKIGDVVYLKTEQDVIPLTIKSILNIHSDMIAPSTINSRGVILISPELSNGLTPEGFLHFFSQSDFLYNDLYKKNTILHELNQVYDTMYISYVLLTTTFALVYYLVEHRFLRSFTNKLKETGYSPPEMGLLALFYCFLFGAPLIIGSALIAMLYGQLIYVLLGIGVLLLVEGFVFISNIHNDDWRKSHE